jgi:hypothetical protein
VSGGERGDIARKRLQAYPSAPEIREGKIAQKIRRAGDSWPVFRHNFWIPVKGTFPPRYRRSPNRGCATSLSFRVYDIWRDALDQQMIQVTLRSFPHGSIIAESVPAEK